MRVEARLQRQESLRTKEPIRLWAILDEAVLYRQMGGSDVVVEQLKALMTSAAQPHATCTAPRLPADDLDHMILQALHDFYTTAEPVLTAMIERANSQHDSTTDDRRAELTAIAHQITTTQTAIDRYHTAFENSTMDDATAGPRTRVQNPHRHDNAPARNGRGHFERTTGSHNGAVGGAEGTRTPDPHTASVVRYQLRHGPLCTARSPGHERTIHTPAGAVIARGARLPRRLS